MNVRVHSVVGSGVLLLGLAAVTGCGHTSPASPSSASAPTGEGATTSGPASNGSSAARPASGTDTGSPLVSGAFAIADDSGDSVVGTYTGTAYSSAGTAPRASLTMQITGGAGAYAGGSGSMTATGVGAFSGEGSFAADVKGDALVNGKHVPIRVGLIGTSSLSCQGSQVLVTQTATGSMKRTGDVHATLSHIVAQAGCGS